MALIPKNEFTGQIDDSDPSFPYGKAQNITIPGDGTGTPWEERFINEVFGSQQALLDDAGVVPNEVPESVGNSQYLEALHKSVRKNLTAEDYTDLRTKLAALTYKVGDVVYVKSVGMNFIIEAGTTDNTITLISDGASGFHGRMKTNGDGVLYAEWVGFKTNQGAAFDAAVAFNKASQFVRDNRLEFHTVKAGGGLAHIQTPLKILQSVNYDLPRSNNVGIDGLEFIATDELAALTPPVDIYKNEVHLAGLSLIKTPMMYNTQLLTRQDGSMFNLNANGKDVYGAYINERYFGSFDITVTNCPNSPITMIYNQLNGDKLHEVRSCGGAIRYVNCNSTLIENLDIELNNSSDGALHIVHNISTKNNVRVLNLHYEESDTIYPTNYLVKFGGRGITFDYGHWTLSTIPATRYIDFLQSGTAYAIDGATVNTTPCLNNKFVQQMFTANTVVGRFGTDTSSCEFDTTLSISTLVNNSTSNNHLVSDTTQLQIGRAAEFTNSDGTRLLGSDQDNRVNLFDNANRYINLNGANIEYVNTSGRTHYLANSHYFYKGNGTGLDYTTPLYMFGQFVWIDAAAGAWRKKATPPASDTDGTLM